MVLLPLFLLGLAGPIPTANARPPDPPAFLLSSRSDPSELDLPSALTPITIPQIAQAASVQTSALPIEHILFITLDGFDPRYLGQFQLHMLNGIRQRGVWVRDARGAFPSLTAPNMASLLTGAHPSTHGIPSNEWYDSRTRTLQENPRGTQATSIAKVLRGEGWATASVQHFILKHDVETYVQPGGSAEKDLEAVRQLWAERKRRADKRPLFLAVLMQDADRVGHQAGPYPPRIQTAVERLDEAIRKLLDLYEKEGVLHRTLVIVTSDHGMSGNRGMRLYRVDSGTFTGPSQPGARKFRVQQAGENIRSDTEIVYLLHGNAAIYWGPGISTSRKEEFQNWIHHRATSDGRAIFHVLGRDKLDERKAAGNLGDLVLEPADGFFFFPYSIPGFINVSFGFHGTSQEQSVLILLAGPGLPQGLTVESGRSVDVVPTILHLLGIHPPATCDGTPLPLRPASQRSPRHSRL